VLCIYTARVVLNGEEELNYNAMDFFPHPLAAHTTRPASERNENLIKKGLYVELESEPRGIY
jgi:hypothetical protein